MHSSPSVRLEAEMTAPVRSWLCSNGHLVREEFQTTWGRCDLVALKPDNKAVEKRLGLGQKSAIGSLARFSVLDLIPDCQTGRVEKLEAICIELDGQMPAEKVRKNVKALVRAGFVEQRKEGELTKINGWDRIEENVVAVELKLTRVHEAIEQAKNNLAFADLSYVGFPSETAQRVLSRGDLRDRLLDEGIGLLSVSEERVCELIKPHSGNAALNTVLRSYSAERFWPELTKCIVS